MERRSLKLPITLGVILIVLVLLLTTGWVLLNVFNAVQDPSPGVYWALLTIGAICFLLVLIGIIIYLVLSIRVINSTARQANFIDAVTHELKTPIASLKLAIQTLNTHQLNEDERVEFYRLMLADAQRLDTMINQVLAAARLAHPANFAKAEDLRLDELLETIAAELLEQNPNVDLRLDVLESHVRAPESELRILVGNLVSNAIKYGGTPPSVYLSCRPLRDHSKIQILVRDNGQGIPLRDRARIFHRFVRLENELERRRKGTGLGLYLVKTIVNRMKGKVRIVRSDSRHGTTFEVLLPATSSASLEQQYRQA
jgi:two-component system phosphate regulon sensor histidine kinase PhoR